MELKEMKVADVLMTEEFAQEMESEMEWRQDLQKNLTNYTPVEIIRVTRLKTAQHLLSSSDMTVAEITYQVGFTSPSYFTKCYKDYFGENPNDTRSRKK